jgi:hypothetical protein
MRDMAEEFHGEIVLRESINFRGDGVPSEHISEECHKN